MASEAPRQAPGLAACGSALAEFDSERESMWLDVISKMEQVYSDLIRYETDLESKNTELEEAQAFISSVIASVSDVLVVVDAQGVVQQVNPAFLRLVRAEAGAVVGQKLEALLAHSDGAAAGVLVAEACEDREVRFATAQGPSDVIAIACSPRLDHAGRRAGAVLTGRPIGELKRAYAALHRAHMDLQQAQRRLIEQEKMASLGRLVAGVAHELNNPVSFVFGNVHTLEKYRRRLEAFFAALDAGEDPQAARRAQRIDPLLADLGPLIEGVQEGAGRIGDIVRNLRHLSFTRPGDEAPVDMGKLVRNAVTWAARAKGSGATVEVTAAPDCVVQGQEGRLHQVVVNLVENALYAVRGVAQPRVAVAVAREDGFVAVHVSDNGPGVAASVADKIFEPFFTTKAVGDGTGLGLWISYSIAREHGGEIVLAPEGQGGHFVLRLPG